MLQIITNRKVNKCSYYFALEEYLLKKESKEEFFFIWEIEKSLVVGRNQSIFDEINVDKAKNDNIYIYRRPSGGGAVFADENCFMFSFISPNFDVEMVFNTYLDKIVKALNKMGIPSYFEGRNDLLVEGKKFSGNAFYRHHNYACLHGTILFATDLSKMGVYLTPNHSKLTSKGVKSVESRVTNLLPYYKKSKENFLEELFSNLNLNPIKLTLEEEKIIEKLQKKYEEDSWIYRKETFTKQIITNNSAGLISLNFLIENNLIKNFALTGDFFEKTSLANINKDFLNIPFELKNIISILEKQPYEDYIHSLDKEAWLKQIEKSFHS